ADEAVEQILAAAPFLWMSTFAAARQSLAGELLGAAGDRLWVAGPSASRSRLLAACAGKAELAARLAGAEARDWWEGAAVPPVAGPSWTPPAAVTPAAWRARIAASRLDAPVSETARLELAAAFAGLGRFNAALATLAACRAPAARLLRARCQQQLGRLGAARSTLRRLAELPLAPDMAIEAAEIAVRIFANSGEPNHVPLWVRRAQAAARTASRAERARSFLVAAVAAWDRQDLAAMDAPLEAARAALFDGGGDPAEGAEPGSGPLVQALWRWHHARGLRAMTGIDGAAGVEHLGRALRGGRGPLP